MIHKLALFLGALFFICIAGCTSAGPSPEDSELDFGDSAEELAADDSSQSSDEFSDAEDLDESDLESEISDQEQAQQPDAMAQGEPEPPEEPDATPTPEEFPEPMVTDQTPSTMAQITNIKYLANKSGGTIVIETSAMVSYEVRNKPESNQFVVEISGVSLPDKLKRPYLMKEFDAAFAAINAYQNPGSDVARIVIQGKGAAAEPVVQQEGNSILVIPSGAGEIPNIAGEAAGKSPEPEPDQSIDVSAAERDEKALGAQTLDEFVSGDMKFYGRPISIEVTDGDIRDVLNFIAVESGINMIMADGVTGRISLKLRNIPWDQALVTIMKAKSLGYIRQGNVVRISTLDALQKESDSAKRILEAQKILAPLRVRVIPVSYAAVESLQSQITPFLTATRGKMANDPRTSSLIITDTEDVLDRVSRLIKELDIPPAQVMIEGKVVEAQDSFAQTLGLNWGFLGRPTQISAGGGLNGGPINLTPNLTIQNLDPGNAVGANFSAGVSVATLDFFGSINAVLSLAEGDQTVKVLSSPRVVTVNKQKATIQQKGEVITISSTVDQATRTVTKSASSKPFSLELSVIPQITADGSVIMEVTVRREFPGSVIDAETRARPINTREAKTSILVRDGQTAVIGGIYSADNTTQENGVPLLKDIPVLGWLFKSRVRSDVRNELLIFLTPKILNVKDQSVES